MDKESSSEIDWSSLPQPLPSNLFDKYTHQSFLPPLSSLGISESDWEKDRSFALELFNQGFLDPISILYSSFKRSYSQCPTIRSFVRWLNLYEKDSDQLKKYCKEYPFQASHIQSIGELVRQVETIKWNETIRPVPEHVDQLWFFFCLSIRLPSHGYQLITDVVILDESVTRISSKPKKPQLSRVYCLFAVTPSGKFSNQLILCKPIRGLKLNWNSSAFTRILANTTGDILPEHLQQWFEDFLSLNFATKNSAILFDPRTTLLTRDLQKSSIDLITIDFNTYLARILSPIISLLDRRWSNTNQIDKMFLKSPVDLRRLIFSLWYSLRTLKQNDDIAQLFQSTSLWRNEDQLYRQSFQPANPTTIVKKKKKKLLVKTGSKGKLPPVTIMPDPPNDSTPEQIFSHVLQRQLSFSRASKFLGGVKLDYLKSCFSYKSNSSSLTSSQLVQLNHFMQSQSTVDWLRHLRSIHFWPCAQQIFLREIYQLTALITKKRSMNICANGTIGSIRSCDLQSPYNFWKYFEEIHQIQFEKEPMGDPEQWHDDFQQYLVDHKLDCEKTQLWTLDTLEFPLIKNSTVLQLPEWNEFRPMNLTPKVSILYAFSTTGQSIEPKLIFPDSLRDNDDEENFYNQLGHLTPQLFLSWIEKEFLPKVETPVVLIVCSRLPIVSQSVLKRLSDVKIYPYGYPFSRTLPFRYLFERRVRNNRSTNLMSELWKKKLLDEQRTHVLKASSCTVKTIQFYFQQIWSLFLHEKQDDDDEHQTWLERCQQAFQQANIQIKINQKSDRKSLNITDREDEDVVQQLHQLLSAVNRMKEQVHSDNSSQILKMNNHFQQETSTESSDGDASSTGDKRSIDENDGPQLSKRLRSSTTTNKWIPPSKDLVLRFQSQSGSLFQFVLLLVHLIVTSIDDRLTAEHSRWLHSTIHCYYDEQYNVEKVNLLIETACHVTKMSLVR